jgi:hypothetical protein
MLRFIVRILGWHFNFNLETFQKEALMAQMEVRESSPDSHCPEASTNANQSTTMLAKREPEYTLNTNVSIISSTMEHVEIQTLFVHPKSPYLLPSCEDRSRQLHATAALLPEKGFVY